MGEQGKSFRIDWFDGTVTENTRPTTSNYFDEEGTTSKQISKQSPSSQQIEKKAIGFKRLLDLSYLSQPILNLELSNRPGFWLLFKDDLKGDFIVLLVKIIKNVYQSLDAYDTSKIVYLLKDEFEKSDFLRRLKEYLIDIPKERTVNKPRNAYLWDDVESFYFSVLDLCAAIVNLGNNSNEYLKKLYDILEVAETSAIAVQEEHMEPIKSKFYEELYELKMKLEQSSRFVWEEIPTHELQSSTQELTDKSTFRNLNIFPNKDDLLSNKNVKIEPNIIDGAYPSITSYLDLQFRLLREDLYGPLREGLSKYIENPSKRRFENIRVYPKVRIMKIYALKNKIGYLIDLAWSERLNIRSVNLTKYARDKWLMCGSLLLFTNDNFDNILFATVLDSSIQLLKEGYIIVSFETPLSKEVFSKQFLMVESEVFFEPYHQVLKVLQGLPSNTLPMKRYILDVQKETKLPAYLKPGQIYLTRNDKLEEISFPVTSPDWPSEKVFGLEKSQMEVFKFALTKEFAVIQGPPGTGKTYMGVKIASTILRNFSLLGTPMLIICYTNHALDQFLEQITKVTLDIVRLGGQGKSRIADLYNINRMRKKVQSKHSYLYGKKRSELNLVFEEITKIQTDIDKCENMVLASDTIKSYLKLNRNIVDLRQSTLFEYEDAVLTWLFGHLHGVDEPADNNEDWEAHLMPDPNDDINTCFSETYASDKIRSLKDKIKAAKTIPEDQLQGINLVEIYERNIKRIQDRLYCLKKYVAKSKSDNKLPHKISASDPYKLTTDERWQLYFNTVDVIKDKLVLKLNKLMEKYTGLNRELEEISSILDCELLQYAKVIGVTTTMAARRRDLMTRLKSPIVIVEEAAEVLESHIITSITNYCQHLILIGDHKQLRPSAAHYILAKHYNMDISLFERMIRNGVHARTLTTQRRMRANFVDLLVPIIYEELDCHPTVLEYPPIKGMSDTLFFLDHDVLEDSEESKDTWTHKNTFEAKWCVSLANYLRKMEYAGHEITILATYNGQASLIQEIAKKYPLLEDVNITVVDNYQGEENRIVILSLVRSNKEKKIGFLSASNRICVALSRAKEGFYMFGNMKVLRSSPIWRAIHEKLQKQNAIGTELLLKLNESEEAYLSVKNSGELDAIIVEKPISIWQRIYLYIYILISFLNHEVTESTSK